MACSLFMILICASMADTPPPLPAPLKEGDDGPPPLPAPLKEGDDGPPPLPAPLKEGDDGPPPLPAPLKEGDDGPPPLPALRKNMACHAMTCHDLDPSHGMTCQVVMP